MGRGPLRISYLASDEQIAVVTFDICHLLLYGHPNDEVLNSHPLYGCGLQFYTVHRVLNSTRLEALERANAVHPGHDPTAYLRDKEHYVFTFQDATLECLVTAGIRFPPSVMTFATLDDAAAALRRADPG
jgi:hypothetical protein